MSITIPAGAAPIIAGFFDDVEQEFAGTRRMLSAFPNGHGDFKPHEKSRSLAALATHVATIPALGAEILTAEYRDVVGRKPLVLAHEAPELVALFDEHTATLRALLAGASPEALEQPWALRAGDRVLVSAPRRTMLRTMVLSHTTHHRAQLGVYYRLLGAIVPGMYGPSADEGFPR